MKKISNPLDDAWFVNSITPTSKTEFIYTNNFIKLDNEYNKSLSWKELQQMVDEPVWIQEGDHGYWIIIESFTKTQCGIEYLNSMESILRKDHMGIGWNAYRKKIIDKI